MSVNRLARFSWLSCAVKKSVEVHIMNATMRYKQQRCAANKKKCAANKERTLQTKTCHASWRAQLKNGLRCSSVECCDETENIWILWMLVTSSYDDHKGHTANKKDALQTKKRTLRQKREPLQSCAVWRYILAKVRYFLFKFEFAFNLLYPRFYLKVLSCDIVVSRWEIWIPIFKFRKLLFFSWRFLLFFFAAFAFLFVPSLVRSSKDWELLESESWYPK